MSTTAIERRVARLERQRRPPPSRWAKPCALAPLPLTEMREVIKTLIETTPVVEKDPTGEGHEREEGRAS
jgi:hypothetical protein